MILLHDFIFVFIPCFFGLVLEKMEHRKNVVKNGGISWAYRELSIEAVFKPLHIMLWTWTKVPWAISDKYSISVSWAFGGFFICYSAILWSTWNSVFHLILITDHWEFWSKVGFLSQCDCLVWFELRTFWFDHCTLTQ